MATATDDQDTSTRDALRRATVEQVIGVVGLVISVIIISQQRKLDEPDYWKRWRMRIAKRTERIYATSAAALWRRAEASRLSYEAERDG